MPLSNIPWRGKVFKAIENVEAIQDSNRSIAASIANRVDDFLSPVSIDERNDPLSARPRRSKKRCSDIGFLALAEAEYLTILDWMARNTVDGKRWHDQEIEIGFSRLQG